MAFWNAEHNMDGCACSIFLEQEGARPLFKVWVFLDNNGGLDATEYFPHRQPVFRQLVVSVF